MKGKMENFCAQSCNDHFKYTLQAQIKKTYPRGRGEVRQLFEFAGGWGVLTSLNPLSRSAHAC